MAKKKVVSFWLRRSLLEARRTINPGTIEKDFLVYWDGACEYLARDYEKAALLEYVKSLAGQKANKEHLAMAREGLKK